MNNLSNNARAKYRIHRNRTFVRLFIAVAVLLLLLYSLTALLVKVLGREEYIKISGYEYSGIEKPTSDSSLAAMPVVGPIGVWGDEIYSSNAMLFNDTSGEIVYAKDGYSKIYPASITKVMTALVTVDMVSDLQSEMQLGTDMFEYIVAQNASTSGFFSNEKVKVIDLLHGLLLESGAEAAIGLAENISGSEADFSVLMNKKAEEIGMKNTHFVNSTGLHDDDHYTTVYDLVLMMRYALRNETVSRIMRTREYTTSPTNMRKSGLRFTNTIFMSLDKTGLVNNYIEGGKTGFTLEALQCLASFGTKNGDRYILITIGAGDEKRTKMWHALDAISIFEEYC